MRRFSLIFALVLGLFLLCLPASAASAATRVQSTVIVAPDGSAQVNMSISLHLDQTADDLYFPIPKDAVSIQLNGTLAETKVKNGALRVYLPALGAGDFSFTLTYKLPLVVLEEKTKMYLQLELLSGFPYPIEALEFTVTLPEEALERPEYFSGYHQAAIESALVSSTLGNTISGATTQLLKDHETLQLRLAVPATMFPQVHLQEPLLTAWDWVVLACVLLAVLYYLISLLPVIPRRIRCFTAPEGISAGEIGTCLTGCGADLSMMVLSWAQLGYLQIRLERDRKLLLVKRMDMGNERSDFEGRVFRDLFRSRAVVSGTGQHYARLCRKVSKKSPLLRQLFARNSGNPRIFRVLSVLAGIISGVSLAVSISDSGAVQTLLGILFAILCGAFSYFIQNGGKCLPLRDKSPLYVALGCGALWLTLGLLTGEFGLVLPMVLYQFLAGIAAAFGGRRSERGKRCLAELQSLRKFLLTAPAGELQRMLQINPNYFYEVLPYALAMGVEKQFAKRLGRAILPDQSFFLAGDTHMNAQQLVAQLGQTLERLNALQKRLPYEQLRPGK